jgi:MFS family permease
MEIIRVTLPRSGLMRNRTVVFLYLAASMSIAEMIAPIIAARLMEYGDWYPLLLSLAIQQAGVLIAVFFPETLHLRDLPEPRDHGVERIELQTKDEGIGLRAQLKNFKAAFRFLRSDATLALVIVTFLANRLGRQTLTLLLRYASKRYNWKIKKVSRFTRVVLKWYTAWVAHGASALQK